MLLRLVRQYLAPYRRPLAIVVLLQFVGTMGALYLPSLNADIIDNGVVTGDTGYILRIGAVMLGVALRADRLLDRRGLVRRQDRDELRPRRPRRDLPPRRHVLPARGAGLRCPEPDHPPDQRRPAGADARADVVHADGDGPDHDGRRHHHGDPRGPRAVLADRGHRAGARRCALGFIISPDGAELPADAGPHRRGQPAAPRADHRRPRGPRVRPRAARDRALRRRQRRPHRGRRSGPGAGRRRCSRR